MKITCRLFQKNPHPPTDGILEILAGAGSKTLEIQAGGGRLNYNRKILVQGSFRSIVCEHDSSVYV